MQCQEGVLVFCSFFFWVIQYYSYSNYVFINVVSIPIFSLMLLLE